MNLDKIKKMSGKPALFTKSTHPFWDDKHISRKMLEAHLDPKWDAASRNHKTIDRTVDWLDENIFGEEPLDIVDLGCGPGLYCSRLAERDHRLTGIDFSERSIEYAREYARKNELDITYINQDYLKLNYISRFDVIIFIYGDFGVLSNRERDKLLSKIYRALKPGGYFIFDVFTHARRKNKVRKNWQLADKGFWSKDPYLSLTETFYYPDNDTYLDQTLVINQAEEVKVYRIWDHVYSKKDLLNILGQVGFVNHQVYSNFQGKEYNENSDTLSVITGKS
ncbi:MAG: class I SAM-dependent methyltransferase [Halanaerobiaceae bacterium]